jgi:hypothetical protein
MTNTPHSSRYKRPLPRENDTPLFVIKDPQGNKLASATTEEFILYQEAADSASVSVKDIRSGIQKGVYKLMKVLSSGEEIVMDPR